jgi:hypothetical protein
VTIDLEFGAISTGHTEKGRLMMITQPGRNKKFAAALILIAMPLFAACNSGDDSEVEEEHNLIDNSNSYNQCTSWIAYYEDPAGCGTVNNSGDGSGPQPPPNATGDTPPPSGSGVAALINDELESNDTLANANAMSYPTRSSSITHVGWVARGSIDDLNDHVDYFVFTAPLSRDYIIRLCPPTGSPCNGTTGFDTLTVFFELLDQDGNVLLSSQAMPTNAYEMAIDAGVVYYLRVMAADTMGATVTYNFQAFEKK